MTIKQAFQVNRRYVFCFRSLIYINISLYLLQKKNLGLEVSDVDISDSESSLHAKNGTYYFSVQS